MKIEFPVFKQNPNPLSFAVMAILLLSFVFGVFVVIITIYWVIMNITGPLGFLIFPPLALAIALKMGYITFEK